MQGTPEFSARLDEITNQFDEIGEQLTFLIRLKTCVERTDQDVHRWPLFDMFGGVASYRAVIGTFAMNRVDRQFVLFYEKHRAPEGTPFPFWIWADHVDPT